MNYEQIYTSIACNRFPACLDLNENLEIVFGANNAIAISDLKYKKIETFVKHKSSVLTVKWVRNQSNRICVSGSNDNNAIFWDLSDCDNISSTVLDGHTGKYQTAEKGTTLYIFKIKALLLVELQPREKLQYF